MTSEFLSRDRVRRWGARRWAAACWCVVACAAISSASIGSVGCAPGAPAAKSAQQDAPAAATATPEVDKLSCMVASVHPLATDAGVAAFERGGNAVDAAIATALTLGVVDSSNSGIGGGCFILIRAANGTITAIDGRETAPAAATRDMFLKDGEADPNLSQNGALAVATPGAIAAYQLALEKHGELKLADLLRPAADLAEQGFPIDRIYAERLKFCEPQLVRFAGTRAVLLKGDRTAWPRKHVLKQRDLAKTYRAIAEEGIDYFYHGRFAAKVGEWMADNHGILTAADFAAYKPVEREPLVTHYRDWTVVGFPPPSSGGVHVAQILNILSHFDLAALHKRDQAQALHVIGEAMKLAFADRAYWLGDPDFVDVPRGLIDESYAAELAKRIDPKKTIVVDGHGDPPGAADDFFGHVTTNDKKHTTHIAAVDADGTWVAITATINTHFGSKVIVPGTGVLLNNEMDDFSAQPGKPNAFGLVGAEANAIEPLKRPLSSMSPTILLEGDKPVLTVGAAGGPKIITQVLQAIIRRFDFDQALHDAVAAPRIHHQWRPDALMVEDTMPAPIVKKLNALGHTIELLPSSQMGATQAIELDAGDLIGVFEPRTPGKAASGKRVSASK
jgi:gamma-glutamyltranspeptidase/glutathione hydrolase